MIEALLDPVQEEIDSIEAVIRPVDVVGGDDTVHGADRGAEAGWPSADCADGRRAFI